MIDIVIFAVITVVLAARLWSVLGQHGDDSSEKQNPFSIFERKDQPPESQNDNGSTAFPDRKNVLDQQIALPPRVYSTTAPPNSLAGELEQISRADPSFDEKKFIQGARVAFSMIVEAFAKGDLSGVERFLAPSVLYSFRQALAVRIDAKETLETSINEITEAEVSGATLKDGRAFLTVNFISRQINVTRDSSGKVIAGNPDQVEEIRDVWVFSRNIRSSDPNWQLVETKS